MVGDVASVRGTVGPRGAVFHELLVSDVRRLCADAVAVEFAVPADLSDEFAFRPGQSLTLRRVVDGRQERRSYSICAPAGGPPTIGVRRVPDGLFSTWLVDEVRPGTRIEVARPTGSFTPDVAEPARHVLVAAGSGITPVLSIAASVLANPHASVTLLYGNRRSDTVMFADELADLKDAYPARFELVHVLSREQRDVALLSGRLDEDRLTMLLRHLVPVPDVDHWWLCGPYRMVSGARRVLADFGVPADRVHRELFYVDEPPPEPVRREEPVDPGETSAVTLLLDGRASTMPLPKAMPILDAAQRVRPDLPFACKGGVCGTCRARLTSGEVRMRRNFALEEGELAAGFVLTCQALPVSDRLTVDYDG